jgi:hypothetical protein
LYCYHWLFRPSRTIAQPVPQVTGHDVLMVVRRDFPDEQFGAVMALLNEYGDAVGTRKSTCAVGGVEAF